VIEQSVHGKNELVCLLDYSSLEMRQDAAPTDIPARTGTLITLVDDDSPFGLPPAEF
jgi:hypothetical protein